ncbi:MAG: hypothetical protein CSA55_04595 [Ilumatobacter coccineus]|uniref:Uncharacterized protein n=1 Tax=Ilumatobacter coccineus TaxID=467094 RepID=A0A2G6KA92_9ACTN|nr:MAG: hypothetical protein CSA55_04595 [Ilumatobacter coccineus]
MTDAPPLPPTTLDFAGTARVISRYLNASGLVSPGFRCPPRLVGVDRSIRHRGNHPVVSVRVKGRPWPAVVADMIEGVVVANRLDSPHSDQVRRELWARCQRADVALAA